ncbi:MAG TPA: septum formation protein Maf [Rhodospirillaceae bacterium]|nr:septum formation protein Maf [Rhodospirillaceae bacterium]
MTKSFILASSSPRRLALLASIDVVPDSVLPAACDETPRKEEKPFDLAVRLAAEKGAVVAAQKPNAWILSADTVVGCGRRILPKAETQQDVRSCLSLLSGRRHHVMTGVALYLPTGEKIEKCCKSVVTFKRLSSSEIESYVSSGEGIGKAGGYAIQGRAACFVRFLAGSYSNVVGLPLFEVGQMLHRIGYFK